MPHRKLVRTAVRLYRAALDPSSWPAALRLLAESVGAIGACCLVQNKLSGQVESISFAGPCAELKSDYLTHFAPLDIYTPTIAAAPAGRGLWLSQSTAESVLRGNEWYNDFVIRNGIADILGGKLFETPSHVVMAGIHSGAGRARFAPGNEKRIRPLMGALTRAARLHLELREIGWRSTAALQALEQLSTAVVVVGADGYVFDLNAAAQRIIRSGDGLIIRNGRVVALRSFDQARLAAAISNATAKDGLGNTSGYLLVGRRKGRPAYAVTVAALSPPTTNLDIRLAMLVVVNPEWQIPSKEAVAEFFGLSPAESRLAVALMQGKRLNEIAIESGVEITTLRTQLSSILRKVGVERQTDLARALGTIGFIAPRSS